MIEAWEGNKTTGFLHVLNTGSQQNALLHCMQNIRGTYVRATASLYSSLTF